MWKNHEDIEKLIYGEKVKTGQNTGKSPKTGKVQNVLNKSRKIVENMK